MKLFGNAKEPQDNPYLNARRVWNAHEGEILSSRRTWQIIGILSLLIALSAVGGIVYIGQQSKFVPYVVAVDKLGNATAISRADRAAPVDSRVMQATLAAFISDARLVTPDIAVQRASIFRLYAHLAPKDPATLKMTEFLNGSEDANPFKRAEAETVHIEITSALPQSSETWQIDWIEETRNREGGLKQSVRMRALVTAYVAPPDSRTDEEQIRRTPLGIFVRDFSWAKQL